MIIDGKKEAENLKQEIKKEIDVLKSKIKNVPGLTVILIGDFSQARFTLRIKKKVLKRSGSILMLSDIQKKLQKKKF